MPRRTQRYSKIGDTMKTIDLSGKWNYKTDIDDSQTIDSVKFENNNIDLIPLVAPTSKERINKIITNSKDFVYCVSHAGTTGEQNTVSSNIKEYLQEVKNNTDTPICVGFGISSVETAGAVKEYCDGVIIGSAIVRRIGEEKDFEERKKDVYEFVKKIKSSF